MQKTENFHISKSGCNELELASRVQTLGSNPIATAMGRVVTLKRSGISVIDFSVGEPDFDTPTNVVSAAVQAMAKGQTRYTATDGTPELKKAVQHKFQHQNNLFYELEQITIGAGAKQVIFNTLFATLNVHDEVVIPAPYWTSYPEMVKLCDGTPIIAECGSDSGYKITEKILRSVLTKRTKWLLLNSPSNPSGARYSRQELEELGRVVLEHGDIHVLSDDMYESLIYDQEPAQQFRAKANLGSIYRTP